MSMDASVARGLATVRAAVVPGVRDTAAANACWAPIRIRGPYDGADPINRFVVGDVPRFQNGDRDCTKQFLNAVKIQAATDAVVQAGIKTPVISQAKHGGKAVAGAAVVGANGITRGLTYGELGLQLETPNVGIYTTASNFGSFDTPGYVLAQFPDGSALIGTQPPELAWAAHAGASPFGPTTLAAANANTTGAGSGKGDSVTVAPKGVDIWTTLYVNGETLPGVSLFGVPTYPGDIANLHYTGADIASVSASDPARAAAETEVSLAEYAMPGPNPWATRAAAPAPASGGMLASAYRGPGAGSAPCATCGPSWHPRASAW